MSRSGLREHFTYANVVATIALILAVTGGATAIALSLPKNSVKSKQIAKEAVKTSDIAKDAVTGDKVKESTLGKVPAAAHADSADNAAHAGNADNAANAANAAHATNADHASVADALAGLGGASISPSNLAQAQNVAGQFNETLELKISGFGRFWLRCHQNTPSNSDDTLAFNLSSTQSGKAIDSGILVANEFPLDLPPEIFPIDDTPEGASSEYGTQGRRLYVHLSVAISGTTKSVEIDGGGFDDEGTPGCIGQLHASTSG